MTYSKIIFLRPPGIGKLEVPLGTLYVATAAKNSGYEIEIYDLQFDINEKELIVNSLKENSAGTVLCISALAPHYLWVKEFTKEMKGIFRDLPILVGGHLASAYKELLANTQVDYLCNCEGEKFIDKFMKYLNGMEKEADIPGFIYRENGKIIKNPRGERLKSYLIPDYSLLDMQRYLYHPDKDFFFRSSAEYQKHKTDHDLLSVIMFSRGCTGYCGFCYRHIPGYFQPDINWCVEHLKVLHSQYGVKYFRIDDELFAASYDWVEKFFGRLNEEKLDITFRITGLRVDHATPEMLALLKNNNCIAINYGIESGSQTILDNMNKGTTVEQGLSALLQTRELGMQTMAYVIIGYPGESIETLKETETFLLRSKLPPDYLSIFYAVALPGTKLYHDSVNSGLISDQESYLLETSQIIIGRKNRQSEYYLLLLCGINRDMLQKYEDRMIHLLQILDIFGDGIIIKLFKLIPYGLQGKKFNWLLRRVLRTLKKYL